jgi:excisionase family DNA binding protein
MAERVLRIPDAADRLGIEPSTLYNWCYRRRIASVKIGGVLGIRESVIDAFIKKAERPALR